MKTIAVIPVNGRLPLLKQTIKRLLKKNGCHAVLCAGSTEAEREACTEAGAFFIFHENSPLGKKWNALFQWAKEFEPDAVLFVGSGDWVSDSWIDVCAPLLKTFGMVGKAGCHLLDVSKAHGYRLVHWPGYEHGSPGYKTRISSSRTQRVNERKDEPIGIGRMLSKKALDKMDWRPFEDHQSQSLDWTMYQKVLKNNDGVKMIDSDEIQSMAFSCDLWPNKHTFSAHWSNEYPSERIADAHGFCKEWFPEYDKIFTHL